MVFSGILFLFRFLPCFLLVYFVAPKRMRTLILFFGSLFFYAWGEPVSVLLMLFSIMSGYIHGLLIESFQKKNRKREAHAVFASSIVLPLALLIFFKYCGSVSLPIGISFYTFQLLSYTIDVYRGEIRPQRSLAAFGAYISMFPQLIAGPIVRYQEIEAELTDSHISFERAAYGIRRFVLGLAKKVLLANQAGLLWEQLSSIPGNELTAAGAWFGILAFAFQIYFDFSGYSDMAIGLGAILGFTFPENFRYPYLAASVTQFWRRWHMSLGRWFRDYVYIPLGGSWKGLFRQFVNIVIVWTLTGIWHGSSLNFLLWGLWFAVFLLFEKAAGRLSGQQIPKNKVFRAAGTLYTFLVVLLGWVLFAHDTLDEALIWWRAMFSFSCCENSVASQTVSFLAVNSRVLFLFLLLGATPLPAKAAEAVKNFLGKALGRKKGGVAYAMLEFLFLMGIFFYSIAFLAEDSYNPFLYFRF